MAVMVLSSKKPSDLGMLLTLDLGSLAEQVIGVLVTPLLLRRRCTTLLVYATRSVSHRLHIG